MMRCSPREYTLLFLIPIFLIAKPLALQAEDYSAIRKANEDSIVYVHSKKSRKDGQGVQEHSYGTGFIIEDTGHVMTASHVILEEDEEHVVETFGSIRSRYSHPLRLELVKRDNVDVAIAMFPDVGQKWKPVQFGDSKNIPKDAPLYTLGFPLNSDLASATGILSSKFGPRGQWQTTLPIDRGNSGGPIFDLNGKVVAIASGGNDAAKAITYAIPEFYVTGLRLASAKFDPTIGFTKIVEPFDPNANTISKKFTFYRAVDHDGEESPTEDFCLPDGYQISSVRERVTTINGSGTRLISAAPSRNASNCVTLKAFIKGSGVVRFGPIIVDHKGRGWLGAEIDVEGKQIPRP
jgi:hypothetical protein